jgi:hypothetical protein
VSIHNALLGKVNFQEKRGKPCKGSLLLGGCPLGWETKFQKGCMVVFCYAGVDIDICLVFYVFFDS